MHPGEREKGVPAGQLIEELELRLSRYCVLHIPHTRAKSFVESNHMTSSSIKAYSPHNAETDGDGGVAGSRDAPSLFCADCSLPPTEATTAPSPSPTESEGEQAPWIHLCQLQRVPSSVDDGGGAAAMTSQSWMLRQKGSSDLYVSDKEAAELDITALNDDATAVAKDGECYAAFFQLRMVPRVARESRLRAWQAALMKQVAEPPPSSSFFTVRVSNNTVRLGVPPLPRHSADGNEADSEGDTSSSSPDLRSVVLRRLQTQRGVRVRRIIDAQTEAAVLPCESASVLLAASRTVFTADCDDAEGGMPQQLHREARTQQLAPSRPPTSSSLAVDAPLHTQRLAETDAEASESTPDLFDRLVAHRAHRRDDRYYYDGFTAPDWNDQRTAISMSELASEPGLQLTSVASHSSKLTAIFPHSSPSSTALRCASQGTHTTASVITASAENSRSLPFPQVFGLGGEEDEEEDSEMSDGSKANAEGERVETQRSSSRRSSAEDGMTVRLNNDAEDLTISPVHLEGQSTSSLLGGYLELSTLRDSLRDMNEVFVYEDEETVDEPPQQTGIEGDEEAPHAHGGGVLESLMTQRRRSSLVWSTPAARGAAAGGFTLSESGVGATPLTYRTSTQLSDSPDESPAVVGSTSAGGAGVVLSKRGDGAAKVGGHIIQRLAFSLSPAPSDSASLPAAEEKEEEKKMVEEEAEVSTASTSSTEATADDGHADVAGKTVLNEKAASLSSNIPLYPETDSASRPLYHNPPSASSSSFSQLDRYGPDYVTSLSQQRASTPPAAATADTASSSHHFACTPPSCSASSPPPSAKAGTYPVQIQRFHALQDESTTPLPSCATPPSRSRTSEQVLRDHLRSPDPIPTQSSEAHTPERGSRTTGDASTTSSVRYGKRQREEKEEERASRHRDVTQQSPLRWARYEDASLSVAPRVNASLHSTPPRSLATPTDGSLPSTVVAARDERHRSPIYFSPEELAGMTVDTAVRGGADPADSLPRTPLSRETPPDRHYGYFVASYPLDPRELAEDEADVASWGCAASAASLHASASRSAQQLQLASSSTPQRGPQLSGLDFASSSASRAFPFISGVPDALSERQRRPTPWATSETGSGSRDAALVSGPRVTSQRLRRSESHSASGMETWVRMIDLDANDASNPLGGHGRDESHAGEEEEDEEELMLVTQQEIPDYNAELDLSASASDGEEEDEQDEETSDACSSSSSESKSRSQ